MCYLGERDLNKRRELYYTQVKVVYVTEIYKDKMFCGVPVALLPSSFSISSQTDIHPTEPSENNQSKKEIPIGGIIGIAAFCVIAIAIVLGLIIYFAIYKKKTKKLNSESNNQVTFSLLNDHMF